jgi:hypothetical protein
VHCLLDPLHGLLHAFHHALFQVFVLLLDHFTAVSYFIHQGFILIPELVDLIPQLFVEEPELLDPITIAFLIDFFLICFLAQSFYVVLELLDELLVLRALLDQG